MKKLYDETFTSEKKSSRNIWYAGLNLSMQGEYGVLLALSEAVQECIAARIKEDLFEDATATETNWYFYDAETNEDALGEKPRSSVMVRYSSSQFIAHLNFSDHNFAVNLESILEMKKELTERLNANA
jgi:phage FluMu gp28-like protein